MSRTGILASGSSRLLPDQENDDGGKNIQYSRLAFVDFPYWNIRLVRDAECLMEAQSKLHQSATILPRFALTV